MTLNHRIVLASRPVGAPQLGDFRLEAAPIPEPGEGQLLLQAQWLSLDPYMRGRMSEDKSYAPPIPLGEVMVGRTVSRVLRSRHPEFAPGDLVMATSGWQTHALSDGSGLRRLDAGMKHPSLALGVLGSSGFAAYIGLMRIAQVRRGETVCVAAATGPVGATVVQLARMQGARTIAISGGPTKAAYAKEVLGADVSLDHRAPDFAQELAAAAQGGIDVYFENVGGDVLAQVLPHLRDRARVPICGLIAWYNLAAPPAGPDQAPSMMRTILRKRLRLEGYVVTDWQGEQPEFLVRMQRWVDEGAIAFREHTAHGLQNAPQAFIDLLEGKNFGKTLVRLDA